jgi:hypothetical protein
MIVDLKKSINLSVRLVFMPSHILERGCGSVQLGAVLIVT